jgi:hypothetical protein
MGKLPASSAHGPLVCKGCQAIEGKKPRRKKGGDMRPSFQCPRCKAVTHNLNDIEQSYCPQCKIFYRANIIGLRKIMADMQSLKRSLLDHGDGLITASEFNHTIGALHDLQVLLEGVMKHELENTSE